MQRHLLPLHAVGIGVPHNQAREIGFDGITLLSIPLAIVVFQLNEAAPIERFTVHVAHEHA